MMHKRLLIIPARIGSKRIKKKNIKNFLGKPIINYSIETAKRSKLFHTIHVSSDSQKILKKVRKFNIDCSFLRPKKLSGDNTQLLSVINFVIKKFEKKKLYFDEIWILMPCAPLVKTTDLMHAQKILKKRAINAFTSVALNSNHFQWSYIIKNKILKPLNKKYLKKPSQKLIKTYFDLGLFAGWKKKYFLNRFKKDTLYNFYPIILNKFQSVDIDNIEDWKFAEIIYKNKYHLQK
jgi:N-acylneuraminate cytidylyltransferase